MDLDEALAALPADSPYRSILTKSMSPDAAVRREGMAEIHRQLVRPMWEEQPAKDEAVALAVLRAATQLELPEPKHPLDRGPEMLVFSLVGSAYPSVVAEVRTVYDRAPPRFRLDLLTLVASAATREGAAVLAELIAAHGWPRRVHARFESELSKNRAHADVCAPAFLRADGAPRMLVGSFVLSALACGTLELASIEDTPLIADLEADVAGLVARQSRLRGRPKHELEDEELSVERELALLAELAGHVPRPGIAGMLRGVAALPDAWPAAFAIASLVRLGHDVDVAAIERVARDPLAREPLYQLLAARSAADRIPAPLRSRAAFAASDVARWLSHPGELGHAPEALEQMHVFEGVRDGARVALHLFRFLDDQGQWLAAASGLHRVDAAEGPLSGAETFSRFERWEDRSPEGHASAILENLAAWRSAWAKDR